MKFLEIKSEDYVSILVVFKNSVVYLHWKKDNKKIIQSGNLGKIESEKHSCDTRYVHVLQKT